MKLNVPNSPDLTHVGCLCTKQKSLLDRDYHVMDQFIPIPGRLIPKSTIIYQLYPTFDGNNPYFLTNYYYYNLECYHNNR